MRHAFANLYRNVMLINKSVARCYVTLSRAEWLNKAEQSERWPREQKAFGRLYIRSRHIQVQLFQVFRTDESASVSM